MEDKINSQLDEIFAAAEAKAEKQRQQAEDRAARERSFVDQFKDKRQAVIRPAMESFKKAVEARGVKCKIEETDEGVTSANSSGKAGISIAFLVGEDGRYRPAYEYPSFSFTVEKYPQRVSLWRSTMVPGRGGQSGTTGTVSLDELTEDLVQQKLVELLKVVLG